jgi:hypothetical protein
MWTFYCPLQPAAFGYRNCKPVEVLSHPQYSVYYMKLLVQLRSVTFFAPEVWRNHQQLLCEISLIGHSWDFLPSSELSLGSFRKQMNQSFPTILFFGGISVPCSLHILTANLLTLFRVSSKPTYWNRMILWWSCFPASAGKTAFWPSLFRGDPSPLTKSRNFLRAIPCILQGESQNLQQMRRALKSLLIIVPWHFCMFSSWPRKNVSRFSDQNSERKNKENNGRMVLGRAIESRVTWRRQAAP